MINLVRKFLIFLSSIGDEDYRKGMTEQELLFDKVASRGFIPHSGNGQPVPDDEMVTLMFRCQLDGEISGNWVPAKEMHWGWHNIGSDIVGYLSRSHLWGGK